MNPLSDSPQPAHASPSEQVPDEHPSRSSGIESDPLQSHVARSSSDSELASSDKLSALPDSPLTRARVVSRMERQGIQSSHSAPSMDGLIGHSAIPSNANHDIPKATASEGSMGKGSPFQRVSYEGAHSRVSSPPSHNSRTGHNIHHPLLRDSGVPPRAPNIESALSRLRRTSDPARPPSVFRLGSQTPRRGSYDVPSSPQSRTASPMRFLGWAGFRRRETREEPFVPENPFQSRFRNISIPNPQPRISENFDPSCEDPFQQWLPHPIICTPFKTSGKFLRSSRYFLMDTLPRQVYLHLLFRLPSLYFSRIARVYEDAELSRPDIERLVAACAPRRMTSSPMPPGFHPRRSLPLADEWTIANVSPALVRFKISWEAFIDSLLREWKTLNLVSALLLSAILSMFQNTVMSQDPVIRTAALLSLTSALMSLSFGCIYIVRFATMRTMYKATRWAEEARKTTTFIWWNVWVLLAMPAIWLAWSMVFFITAILSFVWRSGDTSDPLNPAPLSTTAILGPRVAVTFLFLLGLVYFLMIVKTLQNYGHTWDADGEMRLLEPDEIPQVRSSVEVEREREREREDQGRLAPHRTRGRPRVKGEARVRYDADRPSEGGVLSAVTGLGLTNLDGIPSSSSPRSSNELSREKEKEGAVVIASA